MNDIENSNVTPEQENAAQATPTPAPAPQPTPIAPQNPQQGYGYQASYQQPVQPIQPVQPVQPAVENEPPMRVRDWLLVIFLMTIPCINLILLFVWGFSDAPGKKSRANYCKAQLLWTAIMAGVSLLSTLLLGGLFASLFEMIANM